MYCGQLPGASADRLPMDCSRGAGRSSFASFLLFKGGTRGYLENVLIVSAKTHEWPKAGETISGLFCWFRTPCTGRSISRIQKGRHRQGWATCLHIPLETAVSARRYTQWYTSLSGRLFFRHEKSGDNQPTKVSRVYRAPFRNFLCRALRWGRQQPEMATKKY